MTFQACDIISPGDKEPEKVELRKKSAEIIQADQQFAFELFNQVYSTAKEENIMISPLSVSYALGMTYNGAAGTTLDAFNDVLHFDDLTSQEVNESYKDLMGQLVSLDEKIELSIANSIWYVDWANVLQDFILTNEEYFDAAVQGLDFSDPASVDVINDWIEEKTNDKINDMLDFIPVDAYMYLVNAIYFNGKWKYKFDKDDTYEGDFTLADESTHRVDYMKVEGDFNYAMTSEFDAVELPYGDGAYSMVVMMPSRGKSLDSLVNMMDNELWAEWYSHASSQNITVEIPKFKYDFKDSLNDPLKNLGLGTAFSDSADFSGITEELDLYISRVIHQTFIDVDEEGTEAAAVTIVEMRNETTAMPNFFRADEPFLYMIKENSTGAILFMGKVGKPVH